MQVARFLVEAVVSRARASSSGPAEGESCPAGPFGRPLGRGGSSDLSPEGRTQVETGSAILILEPCSSNTRFTSHIDSRLRHCRGLRTPHLVSRLQG